MRLTSPVMDDSLFVETETVVTPVPPTPSERNWKTLQYWNLYRFIVALGLLLSNLLEARWRPFGHLHPDSFLLASATYISLSIPIMIMANRHRPRFEMQVTLQVLVDILALGWMMAASGGVRSGLGLLMIVVLAISALVTPGRMVMFYAALATTTTLIAQVFSILRGQEDVPGISQAGLMGLAFFVTALVAYVLAERSRKSETLAARSASDLYSLAQINQLVIDDMQDGIIVLDGEGRIRQANRQACRVLGNCQDGEQNLAQRLPVLGEYLQQWRQNPLVGFPVLSLGDRGEQFQPVFIAVSNKRVMGAVLLLKDMSRVYAAAQQIKLAALGRLTANIAHEIRNPLAAISHATELLREAPDMGRDRLLQIVLQNIARINHLIQDVMALNRRDRMQRERILLYPFLIELLEDFRATQELPAEEILLEGAAEVSLVFDREHLRQVLTNLMLNAIRYGQHLPASVRVHIEANERTVAIHVLDDGKGISAEDLSRLFEPFFTTDAAGTGLGLYISRELCEANGASLVYLPDKYGAHFRISQERSDGKA